VPADVYYRPPRRTPKPVIHGSQTAFVVGPEGEEIWTDSHGRVKIQFHWDRKGRRDENSSLWIRVSQPWAGKGWGAITVPRIGQEVVVDFLEGDPDRPLITGRVYNAEAVPPYELPTRQTMSTIKSNSSPGGGGFNEIRLEDKKGEEQVFVHGEKNLDVRIKADAFEWIGNDRHLVVKKDQIESVEGSRHESVGGDHRESIGQDRHLKVAGKEAKSVGGSKSLTVGGDVMEVFKGNHSEETSGDLWTECYQIQTFADSEIHMHVGGSFIEMHKDEILLMADKIKLLARDSVDITARGGSVTIKGATGAELKSPLTSIKGDATVIIEGGVVKIN